MLTRNWKTWLVVLLGLGGLTAALTWLLQAQGDTLASGIASNIGIALLDAWVLYGLFTWREVPWVKRVNTLVLTTLGFGLAIALLWAAQMQAGVETVGYMALMVLGFMVGIENCRIVLSGHWVRWASIVALQPLIAAGLLALWISQRDAGIQNQAVLTQGLVDQLLWLTPLWLAVTAGLTALGSWHALAGVARTMLEEALRMKIAAIFFLMLLFLLPVMPMILGTEDRVTYQVQRFITYAMFAVSLLLSMMTVMLAAFTVSREVKSKQTHMTLVKPISRWQYLMGKWLGIVMLNTVLLAVSGIAIVAFARTIAERSEALNAEDRLSVQREILTSRQAIIAEPENVSLEEIYLNALESKREMDPEHYGAPGSPERSLDNRIRQEVYTEAITRWQTVFPGTSNTKTYLFTGLEDAAQAAIDSQAEATTMFEDLGLSGEDSKAMVDFLLQREAEPEFDWQSRISEDQLNEIWEVLVHESVVFLYHPYTKPEPDDQFVELAFAFNGIAWPLERIATDADHEIMIPAYVIGEDGVLNVTVGVPRQTSKGSPQTPMQFNRKEAALEVYYRVGSFESNVARAMTILWMRLSFLAMFGLIMGAMFSFPIACMAAILVYAIAAMSGYLNEAVTEYASIAKADSTWGILTGTISGFFGLLGEGRLFDAFKLLISLVGQALIWMFPSFGQFDPTTPLSDGKVIPRDMLLSAGVQIVFLWTGFTAVIGCILFSRKEIARVQV